MGKIPLYDTVCNRLRYQILSGEFIVGSPLPPERKLADEWGISRNTVVRAYNQLEFEGLIFSKMGSGRFVNSLPPDEKFNLANFKDRLSPYPPHMAELLSLSLSSKEQVTNFAIGYAGKNMLKKSGLSEHLKKMSEMDSSYYPLAVNGHPQLREWIVSWMGIDQITSPEQVVITSGSQEALQLTTNVLAKPGDTIAVEMPTHFGALQLFQSMGMRIIPIPIDQEGMCIDVLEGVLNRFSPRFVYTVPSFQNPTGYTMSLTRRKQLLALSEKYGLPIIEDDAYRHLYFKEEPPRSLKSLDQKGNVIYINTFSKMIYPGLRLGWVAANRSFIKLITRHKELSITTNTLAQNALFSYLTDHTFSQYLDYTRQIYSQKEKVMGEYLSLLKPLGVEYDPPDGGFYYWILLPTHLDTRKILNKSREQNVVFALGDMFLTREAEQHYLRLCYSYEDIDSIERGMDKLVKTFQSEA